MKPYVHRRLHRLVIGLYPGGFRSQFGSEMSHDFEERIEDAKALGSRAVVSLWLREISQLPESLAAAYSQPVAASNRQRLWIAASLFGAVLIIASVASHLVSHAGLYHRSSQLALLLGLLASGVLLGIASVTGSTPRLLIPAALIVAALLFAPWVLDRHLLVNHTSEAVFADLPGVRLDASKFSSAAEASTFSKSLTSEPTSRVRSETTNGDPWVLVTVLRSGGMDGLYALAAMLLVTASAIVVRRRVSKSLLPIR